MLCNADGTQHYFLLTTFGRATRETVRLLRSERTRICLSAAMIMAAVGGPGNSPVLNQMFNDK